MAAFSPTNFEFDGVEGNIKLVVHHDYVIGVDAIEFCDRRYGPARGVHVPEGFHEYNFGTAYTQATFDDYGGCFGMLLEGAAHFTGDFIEHHLPDVMAGFRVLRSGVAQADDEPRIRHVLVYLPAGYRVRNKKCSVETTR